jgi:hypothetical protein
MIRKAYEPVAPAQGQDRVGQACDTLAAAVLNRTLAFDELERRLFRLIHARTGSYQEAARLLNVDWRTLRARVQTGNADPNR